MDCPSRTSNPARRAGLKLHREFIEFLTDRLGVNNENPYRLHTFSRCSCGMPFVLINVDKKSNGILHAGRLCADADQDLPQWQHHQVKQGPENENQAERLDGQDDAVGDQRVAGDANGGEGVFSHGTLLGMSDFAKPEILKALPACQKWANAANFVYHVDKQAVAPAEQASCQDVKISDIEKTERAC
jgi:hypothetical protein